jgi:hypothetical protein
MFGYDRAELIGQPVESLIPADLRGPTAVTGPGACKRRRPG